MMTAKIDFHEEEIVWLRSAVLQCGAKLRREFKALGGVQCDYAYYLERTDKVENWQSENVCFLHAYLNGEHIAEHAEDYRVGLRGKWDSLKLNFLLAYVPIHCVDDFVKVVERLSEHFDLKIFHGEDELSVDGLRARFVAIGEELLRVHEVGPGDRLLDMLIDLYG